MAEQERTIATTVSLLESVSAAYALVGGHAVSLYARPRVTVDVDFLVATRDLPRVRKALERAGHRVVKAGDSHKVFGPGQDPAKAEAAVELLPADLHPIWKAALGSAVEAEYAGLRLRVVTRAALVAMKFASAVSTKRPREDRLTDLADLLRLARGGRTPEEERAARDLAERAYRGAGVDFSKLLDDLRRDRPITL